MEQKTKIIAEQGQQQILITREFELPVELLFRAHVDPEIIGQWMGNTVVKFEARPHGGYRFEKKDANGNLLFGANGVIHEFVPNKKITRTFEMENTTFPVQLDYLEFESLSEEKSKLTMLSVYKSVAARDEILKLPFAMGINMAHNELEKVLSKIKK